MQNSCHIAGILENPNSLFRKRTLIAPRSKKYGPPAPNKFWLRRRKAANLLADFCAMRMISLPDIRSGRKHHYLSKARQDFAKHAQANGIGSCVIADLLHVRVDTVRYYLNDAVKAAKLRSAANARKRRRSKPGRNKAAGAER